MRCRAFIVALCLVVPRLAAAAPSKDEMVSMMKAIDKRFSYPSDFTRHVFIEDHRRNYPPRAYEVVVYRRDAQHKMTVLFIKPKTEAGKAFLRIDGNSWVYDASTGKWDRRTAREFIQVGDVRAADFDEWTLATEYDPEYVAEEKIANFDVHHLKLKAKPGVETGEPLMDFWIEKASGNPLKLETYSPAGKALRTVFYTGYSKAQVGSETLTMIKEYRVQDRVDKERFTLVKALEMDTKPVDDSVFTKAWVETKSR